jgi:hypothetical protein
VGTAAPQVLFLLSAGRSGSTLLELFLQTHPELVTAGEAHLVPFLADDPDATCRCGRPLQQCPVWGPVVSAPGFVADAAALRRLRESNDAGRTLRPILIPGVVTGRPIPSHRRAADGYAVAALRSLDQVAAAGGGSTVVDASKDLYRLDLLSRGSDRRLRTLVVVRDPRGFVCSVAGPAPDPRQLARVVGRWVALHTLVHLWLRQARTPWRLVRYEDLATDPRGTLAPIGRWLGFDPDGFAPEHLHDTVGHGLAGNAAMHGRRAAVALDRRWEHDLDRATQRSIWAATAPVAVRLGYRWRSRW